MSDVPKDVGQFAVCRVDSHRPTDVLAVFVHGLGGDAGATWKWFRARIESDQTFPTDYVFYDYLSFKRRRPFRNDPSITQVTKHLLDEILASNYKKVVFIGHSMGGNIARAAVRENYLRSIEHSPNSLDIVGLILYATPMLGSQFYFTPLTKDGRYVATFSEQLDEVKRFFTDKVNPNAGSEAVPGRLSLPVFGAIALHDRVVRPMSASDFIPGPQLTRINANHRTIVRPESVTARSYKWLRECLDECTLKRRPSNIRTQATGRQRPIISRLSSSQRHYEWERVYYVARDLVEASTGVSVVSATSYTEKAHVAICLSEAAECLMDPIPTVITQEAFAQSRDSWMSLYVAVIGAGHDIAVDRVEASFNGHAPGQARYVHGFQNPAGLEDIIFHWLWDVVIKNQRPNRRGSLSGVSDALPFTNISETW